MIRPRARRVAGVVVTASVLAAVAGVMLPYANATSTVTTTRFAGQTRYDTARLIATYQAPASSSTSTTLTASYAFGAPAQAVLVSGDNFPDALSASFLAGAYKSPTFLTSLTALRPEAVEGLQALGIKSVTIVGGAFAVSLAEDSMLNSAGITTTRIQGADRDATAAMVAQANGTTVGSYRGLGPTALLAADDADHYVDALAGGPMAWAGHLPLLLTPTDSLAPEAQAALTTLGIKHVIILGGTDAVSSTVELAIDSLPGVTTERLEGANRQQTAIAIAEAEFQYLGFSFKQVYLAVGDTFPDALAGGPIGGLLKSPILLTVDADTLGPDTQGFLTANDGAIKTITALGGTNAIADSTLTQAEGNAVCKSASAATTTTAGLLGFLGPRRSAGVAAAGVEAATNSTTTSTSTTTGVTTTTVAASTTIPTCETTTTIPSTTTTSTTTPASTTTTSSTTSTTSTSTTLPQV